MGSGVIPGSLSSWWLMTAGTVLLNTALLRCDDIACRTDYAYLFECGALLKAPLVGDYLMLFIGSIGLLIVASYSASLSKAAPNLGLSYGSTYGELTCGIWSAWDCVCWSTFLGAPPRSERLWAVLAWSVEFKVWAWGWESLILRALRSMYFFRI